jgi:MFS family permease
MCVGYFLVLLDVTIVNVALPSIGTGLGSSVVGLQWVVDGYALALASLLLASGTIGDRRGYKQIVLVGLAVFGIASLGCALAPHVAVLIGTRVLQESARHCCCQERWPSSAAPIPIPPSKLGPLESGPASAASPSQLGHYSADSWFRH